MKIKAGNNRFFLMTLAGNIISDGIFTFVYNQEQAAPDFDGLN